MTYREMIYIIIDLCKMQSDDVSYNEEHIAFLLDKYRAIILKKEYAKNTNLIHTDNYQTICLEVAPYKEIDDECIPLQLRSTVPVPSTIIDTTLKVTTRDTLSSTLSYTSPERYQYVTDNPFTKNIIHATKNYDNYIYLKSANPQFKHLKYIKAIGVFDSPMSAYELDCNNTEQCDYMDKVFPLEAGLITILQESVISALRIASGMTEDLLNNASDDLQTTPYNRNKQRVYNPSQDNIDADEQ